jgi:hypothetical protein
MSSPPGEELQRFRILATTEAPVGRDGVAFDAIWIVEPVDCKLPAITKRLLRPASGGRDW